MGSAQRSDADSAASTVMIARTVGFSDPSASADAGTKTAKSHRPPTCRRARENCDDMGMSVRWRRCLLRGFGCRKLRGRSALVAVVVIALVVIVVLRQAYGVENNACDGSVDVTQFAKASLGQVRRRL